MRKPPHVVYHVGPAIERGARRGGKISVDRDGHGEAKRIMEPCRDRISIQTMTTMLMGYKRPEYLAKIGRIQASEWTIDMLEDAIEQQTPYISDYF